MDCTGYMGDFLGRAVPQPNSMRDHPRGVLTEWVFWAVTEITLQNRLQIPILLALAGSKYGRESNTMSGKALPTLLGMMRYFQYQYLPLSLKNVLYIRAQVSVIKWFFEFLFLWFFECFLPCQENIKELIFFFFLSFSKPMKEAKSDSVQAL